MTQRLDKAQRDRFKSTDDIIELAAYFLPLQQVA